MTPVSADAATVYGDARYTCDFFDPILPGKFLFVDEIQTSTPFSLPNVSDGPPRHAAHEASPILHPASSRTCHTVLSFTFVAFIRRATSTVAGTIKVSIFTFSPYIVSAAAIKSVILPPVHEPMYARSSFVPATSLTFALLSGECGLATSGSISFTLNR